MKKSKAAKFSFLSVVIILIAALIAVSFAGCFGSDETEAETAYAETTESTTAQTEAVLPESGFTINPESFLPEEKTETEVMKEETEKTVQNGNEADNNYLSTLSANDIKMLNIFLSNFSEAYVENIDTSDMEAMIDFVCLNTLINYRENINYTNAQDVINPENGHRYFSWISEEYVAERVDRFFDVELRNVSTESCYYYDGKYYYSGTDGDTYAYFTKVTSATENTDGTITVEYDVYWYDGDTYDQPPSYAYEGIGSENLNGQFEYRYSGTAVVKPVQLGGEGYANYKLVSLERD